MDSLRDGSDHERQKSNTVLGTPGPATQFISSQTVSTERNHSPAEESSGMQQRFGSIDTGESSKRQCLQKVGSQSIHLPKRDAFPMLETLGLLTTRPSVAVHLRPEVEMKSSSMSNTTTGCSRHHSLLERTSLFESEAESVAASSSESCSVMRAIQRHLIAQAIQLRELRDGVNQLQDLLLSFSSVVESPEPPAHHNGHSHESNGLGSSQELLYQSFHVPNHRTKFYSNPTEASSDVKGDLAVSVTQSANDVLSLLPVNDKCSCLSQPPSAMPAVGGEQHPQHATVTELRPERMIHNNCSPLAADTMTPFASFQAPSSTLTASPFKSKRAANSPSSAISSLSLPLSVLSQPLIGFSPLTAAESNPGVCGLSQWVPILGAEALRTAVKPEVTTMRDNSPGGWTPLGRVDDDDLPSGMWFDRVENRYVVQCNEKTSCGRKKRKYFGVSRYGPRARSLAIAARLEVNLMERRGAESCVGSNAQTGSGVLIEQRLWDPECDAMDAVSEIIANALSGQSDHLHRYDGLEFPDTTDIPQAGTLRLQ